MRFATRLFGLAIGLAALLTADGCMAGGIAALAVTQGAVEGEPEPGPTLTTRWAAEAREVQSKATPSDAGGVPRADWGPADDRERDDLPEVDPEAPGDVIVTLGPGVWTLEERVRLKGGTLTITGAGAHRTRLELASQVSGAIVALNPTKVVLRDLTIVATDAGGFAVKGCPDVRASGVHFAAMRYGLHLDGSTATVESCVFAGCERGLSLQEGEVTVRESAFMDCWKGVAGDGKVVLEACAFVEGRDALEVTFKRGSSVRSSLIAGEKVQAGWKTPPRTLLGCLLPEANLRREDEATCRPIATPAEFPDDLRKGLPPGFDPVAVLLALERSRVRGDADPPRALRKAREERAERHAEAAADALKKGDVRLARTEAGLALRFWGDAPLDGAPEGLAHIADLAR